MKLQEPLGCRVGSKRGGTVKRAPKCAGEGVHVGNVTEPAQGKSTNNTSRPAGVVRQYGAARRHCLEQRTRESLETRVGRADDIERHEGRLVLRVSQKAIDDHEATICHQVSKVGADRFSVSPIDHASEQDSLSLSSDSAKRNKKLFHSLTAVYRRGEADVNPIRWSAESTARLLLLKTTGA